MPLPRPKTLGAAAGVWEAEETKQARLRRLETFKPGPGIFHCVLLPPFATDALVARPVAGIAQVATTTRSYRLSLADYLFQFIEGLMIDAPREAPIFIEQWLG